MAPLSDRPQAQAVTGNIHRLLGAAAIAALLTGCATSKHFSNALTEPAEASAKAAEVVASAANDVLRANALGLVDTPPADPTELVCATQEGLRAATGNLAQFGDALETVGKVAEKPDNVSFAGYIHQIRKNKEALAAAGDAPEAERQLAEKKRVADYNRCKLLLAADWSANRKLSRDSAMQLHGITPTLGMVLAFRDIAQSLLKYGEAAQREEAVKATVAKLLPQLEEAVQRLGAPVDPARFGSRVVYAVPPPGAAALAQEMNRTNLGAALSIQRWMTAMQVRATWEGLAACRAAVPTDPCLANAAARANAADFAAQVANYRNLARLDDRVILKGLEDAVRKARAASERHASLGDVIDALSTVGDAVAEIGEGVDALKAARN